MKNLIVLVNLNHGRNRSWDTNVKVGGTTIEHYSPDFKWSYAQARAVHGKIVADMISDLMKIDGVDSIFVKPYEVSVNMATFFNKPSPVWNEKIDRIVKEAFRLLYQAELEAPTKRVLVDKRSPHMRHFDTKFSLSRSVQNFTRPLAEYHDVDLRQIGPDATRLVKAIIALPGVISVFINTYELTVYIAPAFNWTEEENDSESLEDQVKKALENVYGPIAFTNK